MQESQPSYAAGQQVVVRDEPWIVLGSEQFDQVRLIRLRGVGDGNRGALASVLAPFDAVHRTTASTTIRQAGRQTVLARAAAAIADAMRWDDCWTAASARIELRAWQLEPAIAVLNGATRVLLADHVGLGKTIQAALVIAELCTRGLAERVLVLTPPSIREQWAAELRDRFGLAPVVFDHAAISSAVSALPVGVNPWQTAPLIVSSIDLVKRADVRAALDAVAFDVLVVDEAHHLTPGTDRGALVAELAARTPWVVLATATPHTGDDAADAYLRRLGDVGAGDWLSFRRSAAGLEGRATRRSRLLAVTPTRAERRLLDAVLAYARTLRRHARGRHGVRLVASVIARRASSAADAALRTLARRLALLGGETTPSAPELQPALPWEEEGDGDEMPDAVLGCRGFDDAAREIDLLRHLVALAEAARAHSSKLDVLRRLLQRTNEQILVFSEYRDVAQLTAATLGTLTSTAMLHGGMSPRDRRLAISAFNDGRVRTLVATDAAGEGLNLHRRCRWVINIELPWSPLRLEQRIGRVDRLGQVRRVHALHLVHRDSYEATVVARLERRRAHVLARSKDSPPAERTTTAAVERRLRQMTRADGANRPAGAVYASRTRPNGQRRVQLLFAVSFVDRMGRLLERAVVPVAVERRRLDTGGWALTRQSVRRLCAHPRIQSVLQRIAAERAADVSARVRRPAAQIDRRLAALEAEAGRRQAPAAWQGSLFDRRAEQHAADRHWRLRLLARHVAQRRQAMAAMVSVSPSAPRLVAAWLE